MAVFGHALLVDQQYCTPSGNDDRLIPVSRLQLMDERPLGLAAAQRRYDAPRAPDNGDTGAKGDQPESGE